MSGREHQLLRLLEWYGAHRDDEWEHHHGIKLEPLPTKHGWSLIVDTAGTELSDTFMLEQRIARSDVDWFQWAFEPGSFRASGGERNVPDMIARFFDEVERLAEVHKRD